MDKIKISIILAFLSIIGIIGLMIYCMVMIFIIDIISGIVSLIFLITFSIIIHYSIKRSNKKDKELTDD